MKTPGRGIDHLLPGGVEGISADAGVGKMIARLHEELAVYEGSQKIRTPIGK